MAIVFHKDFQKIEKGRTLSILFYNVSITIKTKDIKHKQAKRQARQQ